MQKSISNLFVVFTRASAVLVVPFVVFGVAAPASAQQFEVDDAAIVDYRACQVEAWHGQATSWILPACQPIRNLEITAGMGFLAHGNGAREAEYAVELKTLFRPLETNGFGVGLVFGVGVDPPAIPDNGSLPVVYAFIPASLSLAEDRLILHGNLGWEYERDEHEHNGVVHDEAHHALTWGFRGDVMLSPRFTVIGEFFGEDRDRPEYQVGLRSTLIPDRLLVDLSWGGHTASGVDGAGWTVGLAWTPPPFL